MFLHYSPAPSTSTLSVLSHHLSKLKPSILNGDARSSRRRGRTSRRSIEPSDIEGLETPTREDLFALVSFLQGSYSNAKQFHRSGRVNKKQGTDRQNRRQRRQKRLYDRLQRRREQLQQRGQQHYHHHHQQQNEIAQAFPQSGVYLTYSERRPLLIHTYVYRVSPPLQLGLPDTLFTIFFQDFTRHNARPFRSGFYSFTLDPARKVIRMRTHKLREDVLARVTPVHKHVQRPFDGQHMLTHGELMAVLDLERQDQLSEYLQQLRKPLTPRQERRQSRGRQHYQRQDGNDAEEDGRSAGRDSELSSAVIRLGSSYAACDMFWSRLAPTTFVGITGWQCRGSLGFQQLVLTEEWYKVLNGSHVTERKVPYIFDKLIPTRHDSTHSNDSSTGKLMQALKTSASVVRPYQTEPRIFSTAEEPLHGVYNDLGKSGTQTPGHQYASDRPSSLVQLDSFESSRRYKDSTSGRTRQLKMLRNFRQVEDALTSGHDIGFQVKLSSCLGPQQAKVDRLSFGGNIKDFVMVRKNRRGKGKGDYIFFRTQRTVMSGRGPEHITRDITLTRATRVEVKVIRVVHDPMEVRQEYIYGCKLYNKRSGNGGVKLYLDHAAHVTKVPTFQLLTLALGQGRDLRLLADLSRCQGTKSRPVILIGTYISDYDIIAAEQTIELTVPIHEPANRDCPGDAALMSAKILPNGDVILTKIISDMRNDNVIFPSLTEASRKKSAPPLRFSSAYQCSLANRGPLQTNDENDRAKSVKMFYTT
ncbi:hypothetical protein PoB_002137000 [Plakobranchus ocellatus]|uniref:Uncharacterized protein n=1 Tax=Plakobranchus ocellatus TaxID=259542 RepID=A0AAV3ZGX6_9GAST|nr:hypothetical protein PoB_002137000 [Plakobranchus ocellatus]